VTTTLYILEIYLCPRARVRDVEVKTESELIAGCKVQFVHFPCGLCVLEKFVSDCATYIQVAWSQVAVESDEKDLFATFHLLV
jgi:hypothetical protein